MKVWIQLLILAVSGLAVVCQTCPSDHFSAVITASIDQTFDAPRARILIPDHELTFFKTIMKFREATIQHVTDDAIHFFNNEYGLDFSNSIPNEQNQRFFQNATMNTVFIPPEKVNFIVTVSHWIRSGMTHSTCYSLRAGGFEVSFSGEQILYGSYGGAEGKLVGTESTLLYGLYNIDACKQSPIIIQLQTDTPTTQVNIAGTTVFVFNYKLYNRVLGHGQNIGTVQVAPNPDDPQQFDATLRSTMTFTAE